jgi:hypothetical protein
MQMFFVCCCFWFLVYIYIYLQTKNQNVGRCAKSANATANCVVLSRVSFWMNIFAQLLSLKSYEQSLAIMTQLLSINSGMYGEVALSNDLHHLMDVHCDDNHKLRANECPFEPEVCPFLNDRRHYNHVLHRLHVQLCHDNEPVYRARFDADGSTAASAATFDRFVMNIDDDNEADDRRILASTMQSRKQLLELAPSTTTTTNIEEEVDENKDDSKEEPPNTNANANATDNDQKSGKFGVLDFGNGYHAWNVSQPRFASMKEEVLNNEYASISVEAYDALVIECAILAKLKVAKMYKLDCDDILCLKLYTDFSKLCYEFRKSFRSTISDEEKQQRRSQFCHWAKTMRFLFKSKARPTHDILYHGLSCILTLDSLTPEYSGPVSLSMSKTVSCRFAGEDGMLLAVKSGLIGDEYYSIRGFDVSWISNFFNEREFLVYDAILPIRQNIIVDQNDTDKQARYIPLSTVYV